MHRLGIAGTLFHAALAVHQSPLEAPGTPNDPTLQTPTPPSNTSINPALFADLERSSRLADIAYCVTPPAAGISPPFECLSRCAEFPGFELITAWNTGPLLSDTAGFVAYDHEQDDNGNGKVVIAFRGTYSIANAIVDLSTIPQAYTPYPGEDDGSDDTVAALLRQRCDNCSVHIGFNRAWHNTRDKIMKDVLESFIFHPSYELVLVGHSLGGAVAMLAALEFLARGFAPTVTTFGEPRVGNAALAEYLDQRFNLMSTTTTGHDSSRYRRVTHLDDPVPLLPLTEWGYAMHAGEIFISKTEVPPEIEDTRPCDGDSDPACIAQQDSTLLASVRQEIDDVLSEPWDIPSRYKLWQLIFAHRDYFHRIGVCLAGGDPLYPEPTGLPKFEL